MSTMQNEPIRNFTLSTEIFETPNLDIYTQMTCVVLRLYSNSSTAPTLSDIARLGRMTTKQATKALQGLVDLKILPGKVFREIIGDFADDRLSWAAKGLLVYCKNNQNTTLNELVELSTLSGESQNGIKRALDELRRYGYLDDFQHLNKIFSYQTVSHTNSEVGD